MPQYQIRTGPITNDQAPFNGPEFFAGSHPDRPRMSVGPRVNWHNNPGQPLSQTTHVQAPTPFPDMFSGNHPDRQARVHLGVKIPQPIPGDFKQFTDLTETIEGNKPERARIFIGPKIPLPLSQTTHVQAATPFPEMFTGNHPDQKPKLLLGPKIPPPSAETTPGQFPFSVEMSQGDELPQLPRIFLGPKIPLPISQTTHVQAPFSPEMSAGRTSYVAPVLPSKPQSTPEASDPGVTQVSDVPSSPGFNPRIILPEQIGQPLSQTTHVQAPPSPEMMAGYGPPAPRLLLGVKIPLPLAQTTPGQFPFSVEMSQGDELPQQPRIFLAPRIPLPLDQVNHVQSAFSEDMVEGSSPYSPRLFSSNQVYVTPIVLESAQVDVPSVVLWTPRIILPEQIAQPLSQTTHVQAPPSPEMFAGAEGIVWPAPRIILAERIPLPISQTTHVEAPFSLEMFQGTQPTSPRFSRGFQTIPSSFDFGIVSFAAIESFRELRPGSPRLFLGIRIPLPIPGDLNQFVDFEKVVGNQPSRPVLILGVRIPLPISQTTHVQAPFSPEMTAGSHPDSARFTRGLQSTSITDLTIQVVDVPSVQVPESGRVFPPLQIGQPLSQTTHIQASFSVEMVSGAQGITSPVPRLHLGARIPQPLAQTTHVQAAFSPEMAQGYQPWSPRPGLAKEVSVSLFDLFVPASVAAFIQVPDQGKAKKALQIPLPIDQAASHVQNAFSPDMVQGSGPSTPRVFRSKQNMGGPQFEVTFQVIDNPLVQIPVEKLRISQGNQTGQTLAQTTPGQFPFSVEMAAGVYGVTYPSPRLHLGARLGQPLSQTTHVENRFSPEMVSGAQGITFPAPPHLLLGAKIPLPISQTTHVQAPFGPEMVAGWAPEKIRLFTVKRQFPYVFGLFIDQLIQPVVDVPVRGRAWKALQLPLPISQPTYTDNPFSEEMIRGPQGGSWRGPRVIAPWIPLPIPDIPGRGYTPVRIDTGNGTIRWKDELDEVIRYMDLTGETVRPDDQGDVTVRPEDDDDGTIRWQDLR